MTYIPSHQDLRNHPKLNKLCRILKIERAPAIGHLHLLWWWGTDHSDKGWLWDAETEDIADAAEWPGDPMTFQKALIDCHFLDVDPESGFLQFHNWGQYFGKVEKARVSNANRQQAFRERQSGTSNGDVTVTSRLRNSDPFEPVTVTSQLHNRLDKSREDKSRGEEKVTIAPSPSSEAVPAKTYTDRFERFWKRYPSHNGTKATAFKAWQTLSNDSKSDAEEGLQKWIDSDHWREGYVKFADKFLRERMWENDPAPKKRSSNGKLTAADFLAMNDAPEPVEVIETDWRPS